MKNILRQSMEQASVMGALVAALLAGGCLAPAGSSRASSDAASGRSEQVHRQVAAWLESWPTAGRVETLSQLAEQVVSRLAASGTLYVAGDTGFCDEMDYRAGAFAATAVWNPQQKVGSNDVLLVGWFDGHSKGAREFKPAFIGQNNGRINKALTIVVASSRWPLAARTLAMANTNRWPSGLHFLDTGAPPAVDMGDHAVAQAATIAVAYALEGEMLAAATRRGRTMAFYPSMYAPGGNEYGELIKGKTFLDEPRLAPIAAGQVARRYLSVCREQVAAFLDSKEPAQVRRAARQIAACQQRGGTVLVVASGHVLQRGATIPPALSSLALYGSGWSWTPPLGLRSGDLFFYAGYLNYPQAEVDAALGAGVDVITLSVAGATPRERVTDIRCFWKPYDGAVEIPGYPYKALPSSGVVMSTAWYGLMDEALAALP
jgi:hypothetical protein